jgi:cysteinyl-tRNA synthetase
MPSKQGLNPAWLGYLCRMPSQLQVYNTLTREKHPFEPLNPPFVGMYVCGPTVYSDPHLGHARPYIVFDVVFRYLRHLGYKVRYVRNITDVGHITADLDEGVDRIGQQAKLEQKEPMEVVQQYTLSFHKAMAQLNTLPPSIEPRASGHIIEQLEMVKQIIDAGFAYEAGGSVYFDVEGYSKVHRYGQLSGRVLDELRTQTRVLEGGEDKRSPFDFALWKKAAPEHIMRWPSPWGEGFPGWHLECSVMSTKYLGEQFDIHGGGMDLLFPHHECEIAQSVGATGHEAVRYWLHNNMITINGQKMARSLGNFISLQELFSGSHQALKQAYSPMTVRFFILQTHYRGTLDFSNEALVAAEKGLRRLMNSLRAIKAMSYQPGKETPDEKEQQAVGKICQEIRDAINDDFNTALALAGLFDLSARINALSEGLTNIASMSQPTFAEMKEAFVTFTEDILGLRDEEGAAADHQVLDGLMKLIIDIRKTARDNKDFQTSDKIRDGLKAAGVELRDGKEETKWALS